MENFEIYTNILYIGFVLSNSVVVHSNSLASIIKYYLMYLNDISNSNL